MEEKVLRFINQIRLSKNLNEVETLKIDDDLRNDLDLTSFDLAELTVLIEDEFEIDIFQEGLISTIGQIYNKLKK